MGVLDFLFGIQDLLILLTYTFICVCFLSLSLQVFVFQKKKRYASKQIVQKRELLWL